MANELGPLPESSVLVIYHPDGGAIVRDVQNSQWVDLAADPTFADCIVQTSEVGWSGKYFADMPFGLADDRVYTIAVYADWATAFYDPCDFVPYVPEVGRANNSAGDQIPNVINGAVAAAAAVEDALEDRLDGLADGVQEAIDTADAAKTAALAAQAAAEAIIIPDPAGDGDIPVDHNYGEADRFRTVIDGVPQDGVIIRAYVQADFDAGAIDPTPPATVTGSDGRWTRPLMLDPDTYVLVAHNPATKQTAEFRDVEVTAP